MAPPLLPLIAANATAALPLITVGAADLFLAAIGLPAHLLPPVCSVLMTQ